jgi:hypothetical protein
MCQLNEINEPQSWRRNAELKSSDFNIEILNEEDGEVDVYLVHKQVLVAGVRKSEYFQNVLFNSIEGKEIQPSSCQIKLQARPAKIFPEVLDFMYSGMWNYTSNKNLVSLLGLADYLDISVLKEDVRSEICRLNAEAAYQLLSEAYHLKSKIAVDALLDVLRKSGVSLFQHVESVHLLSLSPSAFQIIYSLMYERNIGFLASSEDLSLAVAVFLESHPQLSTNWKLLAPLTNSFIMPVISPYSAFFFLGLTSAAADADEVAVKSLEQRCLCACEKWQKCHDVEKLFQAMTYTSDSCLDEEDLYMHDFINLPDSVKVRVLQHALKGCSGSQRHSSYKTMLGEKVFRPTFGSLSLFLSPIIGFIGERNK